MGFYGDHNACFSRFEKHSYIKPKWNIKNNLKRTQDIEILSFNPFNFEKITPKPSIFNQRWTFKIKYLQSPNPLMDFFLITILWKVFKILRHVTSKGYSTKSQNIEKINKIIPFKDLRISIFYNVHKYLHNLFFSKLVFNKYTKKGS
jgi:hypothetical protein